LKLINWERKGKLTVVHHYQLWSILKAGWRG